MLTSSLTAQSTGRLKLAAFPTGTPPTIDGRLDDEVWMQATSDRRFTQVDPHEGAPPTEATEIRALYDVDHLYLAIRCFDREPNLIVGTQMRRDAEIESDDRVYVVFDTFEDRRNGYLFGMNAVGAKVDALIGANGENENQAWDAIWEGRSSIDALGWCIEMAIPFKSLSFESKRTEWGFNVQRVIKRRLENDRWASPQRNHSVFQVSEAGTLTGLEGIQQGIGLDIVPFYAQRWADNRSTQRLTGSPGFDLFYRLSPGFGAALTVNTDFAETEVDQHRINLTRFPLFFPEKRDFFLQDAGIFQFADLGSDLVPFFSRRIGLTDNGDEVPIIAGAKVTGRNERLNVGLLDVETDAAHGFERANLSVARISMNVGEQSSVGMIATDGAPNGRDRNSVVGVDANFGTSTFLGDRNLRASLWGLKSFDEAGSGDSGAFGASLSFPNDTWSWALHAKEIQDNFDPALGFVPRTGVREYSGGLQYEPALNRDVRRLEFGLEPTVFTDLNDTVESATTVLQYLGIVWDAGDEFRLQAIPSYERLDQPFDITDTVTIPAGEYDWLRWRLEAESALKRPVSASFAVEAGNFFDGRRADYEAGLTWRPNPHFTGELGYEQNRIDLPGGAFVTQLGFARFDLAFSPNAIWSNFVQFDNESDSLGLNSRVQWILKPGRELNLVFDNVWERNNGVTTTTSRAVVVKLQYTLRL